MSTTQIQSSPKLETNQAARAFFSAALRIAPVIAEANQRVLKVQSEAATAAIAENSDHLLMLLNAKDPSAALSGWADLYQANIRRVHDVTHTCFEILPEIQAELTKLMNDSFASYSTAAQHDLAKFNKVVSDESDATVTAVKDSSAKIERATQQLTKKPVAA